MRHSPDPHGPPERVIQKNGRGSDCSAGDPLRRQRLRRAGRHSSRVRLVTVPPVRAFAPGSSADRKFLLRRIGKAPESSDGCSRRQDEGECVHPGSDALRRIIPTATPSKPQSKSRPTLAVSRSSFSTAPGPGDTAVAHRGAAADGPAGSHVVDPYA